MSSSVSLRVSAALMFAAAAAVYLPQVGHGFVKDDVVWIARSDLSSIGALKSAAVDAPTGFYRPAVSLLFGVNRLVCGVQPRCYGIVNFVLLIACAAGVALLAAIIVRSRAAGIAAAAIWLFNWHGINMAVLWISGRTALALVLFATFGAAAFLERRWVAAGALVAAAMLSKEEAVLLPAILFVWALVQWPMWRSPFVAADGPLWRNPFGTANAPLWRSPFGATEERVSRAEPAWIAAAAAAFIVGYLAVRSRSGAFSLASAPDYYQLHFTAARLFDNVLQYLDRSVTFAAAVVLLFWAIARPPAIGAIGRGARGAVALGVVWWIGGFAITVFLPTRSSLYAVFPSVGAAIAAAALLREGWIRTTPQRQRATILAGLAAPFLLWPLYAARNRPAVREAELSARTLDAVQRSATWAGTGARIVIRDNRAERPSLDDAFGTLVQDAVDLVVRPHVEVWIDPPPKDAARAGLEPRGAADVVLALKGGELVRVR